ncbi:MAG TPA: hypothetical protein VF439_00400 [Candidatus Paceibacterota bacterium]
MTRDMFTFAFAAGIAFVLLFATGIAPVSIVRHQDMVDIMMFALAAGTTAGLMLFGARPGFLSPSAMWFATASAMLFLAPEAKFIASVLAVIVFLILCCIAGREDLGDGSDHPFLHFVASAFALTAPAALLLSLGIGHNLETAVLYGVSWMAVALCLSAFTTRAVRNVAPHAASS